MGGNECMDSFVRDRQCIDSYLKASNLGSKYQDYIRILNNHTVYSPQVNCEICSFFFFRFVCFCQERCAQLPLSLLVVHSMN